MASSELRHKESLSLRLRHSLFAVRKCLRARSFIGAISRTKVKRLWSFISRAHLRNAASATRAMAPPTLMRLTPAADSCVTVSVGSAKPMTRLNGFFTRRDDRLDGREIVTGPAHRARRRRRPRRPAAGGWCRRDRCARSRKFSARAVSVNGKGSERADLDGGLHALDRKCEIVDRIVPVAGRNPRSSRRPRRPRRQARIAFAAAFGSSAPQFSRSALTGRSVASAIARQFSRMASRLTLALPSVLARPRLVVASASKPIAASSLAVPASQGLGMMKAPGRACSARKASAFSNWVAHVCSLSIAAIDRRHR